MVDILHLYISAAHDLEKERESLSRAVVEIPVTLGWRVIQTPLHGELLNMDAIAQADVHILLLGSDIRAPVGLEWRLARRANHTPVVFLKEGVVRTMAALDFIRYLEEQTTWRKYLDIADLRMQTLRLLVDHILAQPDYYSLRSDEFDNLTSWRKELSTTDQTPPALHGGIGESSVVLSPERYIPSDGVLIQAQPIKVQRKQSGIQRKREQDSSK
jgi:hypothetical protein